MSGQGRGVLFKVTLKLVKRLWCQEYFSAVIYCCVLCNFGHFVKSHQISLNNTNMRKNCVLLLIRLKTSKIYLTGIQWSESYIHTEPNNYFG